MVPEVATALETDTLLALISRSSPSDVGQMGSGHGPALLTNGAEASYTLEHLSCIGDAGDIQIFRFNGGYRSCQIAFLCSTIPNHHYLIEIYQVLIHNNVQFHSSGNFNLLVYIPNI